MNRLFKRFPPLVSVLAAAALEAAAAPTVPITALAFSPDNAALVSNGARCLQIRSAQTGELEESLPCDLEKIAALAFDPAGKKLAVAGGTPGVNGQVQIFHWPERKLWRRIANHADVCMAVAFNGTLMGVAGSDHVARIWKLEVEGLTRAFELRGHTGPVLAIAFDPGGEIVVTASADRSIKVWSASDGHLLRTLNFHTESVHALAFCPDVKGDRLLPICASAGEDRTVRIWQPTIGRMIRIVRHHEGSIFALAYAPDGGALYSAGEEGIIRSLDPESDAILAEWPVANDWIYALAISPDGTRLAIGDWSGTVRVRAIKGESP